MTRLLYLAGVPGSGKTTLMRTLTQRWFAVQHSQPFAWIEYEGAPDQTAQIGKDRGTFSGTDALSNTVSEKVKPWLLTCEFDTLLAEGARLANAKFFAYAREHMQLLPVYLIVPPDLAVARRAERGSNQNAQWLSGMTTQAANLKAAFPGTELDGTKSPERLAEEVVKLLWP